MLSCEHDFAGSAMDIDLPTIHEFLEIRLISILVNLRLKSHACKDVD
jgi:hypothetical protein